MADNQTTATAAPEAAAAPEPATLAGNAPEPTPAPEVSSDELKTNAPEHGTSANIAIDDPIPGQTADEFSYVPDKFRGEDGKPNFETLASSYTELEKKLGNAAERPPKDISGYTYEMPEGFVQNEEAYKSFREAALEQGVTDAQYHWMMKEYTEGVRDTIPTMEAGEKVLKDEWKDNYSSNLDAAQKAIHTYLPEDFNIDDHPELGNNPDFIRIMSNIGKELREDNAPNITTPQSRGYSEMEIHEMMGSADYWENKPKQAIVSEWFKKRFDG